MTPFSMFVARETILQGDGTMTSQFYRFLNNLFKSAGGGGATSAITPGGSPFTYTASVAGQVIVSGGNVSQVALSRDGGSTFINTGVIAGPFLLKPQDQLKVTYSPGAPTMTFVPA